MVEMAYSVSDVAVLAEKYNFTFSITEHLCDLFGYKTASRLMLKLSKPVRKYAVRVNTFKINSGDLVDKLREIGVQSEEDKNFKDIIYFPVKGPYKIPDLDKYVIADKFRSGKRILRR